MKIGNESRDLDIALAALRDGRPVLVVDDADRENEGDLVVAAELIDAPLLNMMISEGRGLVCVATAPQIIDRLDLGQMVESNSDVHGTAFTVSVDAVGTGTGISAADRALTIRTIADPATRPDQLQRPGHIFPLRAAARGILERRGHTEAGVELARLAGLVPAAAICEVLDLDGEPADLAYLTAMAARLSLPLLHVGEIARAVAQDLAEAQEPRPAVVGHSDQAVLPTAHGAWTAVAHSTSDGVEHLALTIGDLSAVSAPPVRLHSECLTGDVFGSHRCDCGDQLKQAMESIEASGAGAVIYLRKHEGRGIGLHNKIRAYAMQDTGLDTVDANLELGLPVDARDYRAGAELLRHLGLTRIVLLTNNPDKAQALAAAGIVVDRTVGLHPRPRPANRCYLETKRARLGHLLPAETDELHLVSSPPSVPLRGTHAC